MLLLRFFDCFSPCQPSSAALRLIVCLHSSEHAGDYRVNASPGPGDLGADHAADAGADRAVFANLKPQEGVAS